MRERRFGMYQLQAMLSKRQAAQERRGQRKRVHGGADVVHEAGQCQLLGAAAAAHRVRSLEDCHRRAGLGERDRRREPVGTRADDDGFVWGPFRQPCDRA